MKKILNNKPPEKKVWSPAHIKFVKQHKAKKVFILSCQIGILLFFIFIWELLTALEIVDSFLLSSPSRIVKTIGKLFKSGDLFKHMGTTLYECALGFLISTLLGILIAIALWWNASLRKILDPYIIVLNSLPKIALGPIIIIWVGVGTKSIVVMCILISIVVTIISILHGFISCDPDKILLLESMGANKFQVLTKLILPYSIPNIISVFKMNIGLCWVGTIMGEYLSSKAGLGYLITYGGQIFQLDLVMASTVILCLMATIMYIGVTFLEKYINKNR